MDFVLHEILTAQGINIKTVWGVNILSVQLPSEGSARKPCPPFPALPALPYIPAALPALPSTAALTSLPALPALSPPLQREKIQAAYNRLAPGAGAVLHGSKDLISDLKVSRHPPSLFSRSLPVTGAAGWSLL